MADAGKIAVKGFNASTSIKYVVLEGFGIAAATLQASLVTRGFGTVNTHLLVLNGFSANPVASGGVVFWIFGDAVIS